MERLQGHELVLCGGGHDAADGPTTAAGAVEPVIIAPADAFRFGFDLAFGFQTTIRGPVQDPAC